MTAAELNYDVARERITDFLKTFYVEDEDELKSFIYADQVAQIAQRRLVALYIYQVIRKFDVGSNGRTFRRHAIQKAK